MGLFDVFKGNTRSDEGSAKVKDPHCGMEVHPATAAAIHEANGQKYYFCSKNCKESFVASNKSSHDGSHDNHGGCC